MIEITDRVRELRFTPGCPIPDCNKIHIPNAPLIRKVWTEIQANPDAHLQTMWGVTTDLTFSKDCKTAACFAGHAAIMTGHKFKVDTAEVGYALKWELAARFGEAPQEIYDLSYIDIDGNWVGTEYVAQHELGLTFYEADKLFAADNSRHDIESILDSIFERFDEEL